MGKVIIVALAIYALGSCLLHQEPSKKHQDAEVAPAARVWTIRGNVVLAVVEDQTDSWWKLIPGDGRQELHITANDWLAGNSGWLRGGDIVIEIAITPSGDSQDAQVIRVTKLPGSGRYDPRLQLAVRKWREKAQCTDRLPVSNARGSDIWRSIDHASSLTQGLAELETGRTVVVVLLTDFQTDGAPAIEPEGQWPDGTKCLCLFVPRHGMSSQSDWDVFRGDVQSKLQRMGADPLLFAEPAESEMVDLNKVLPREASSGI